VRALLPVPPENGQRQPSLPLLLLLLLRTVGAGGGAGTVLVL